MFDDCKEDLLPESWPCPDCGGIVVRIEITDEKYKIMYSCNSCEFTRYAIK